MYIYLKQFPDIYLSVFKEPHFFGSDLTVQPHTIRDPHLYQNLFEGSQGMRCVGEGSVWYLRSEEAAHEIHAFNPEMKILLMLRDPVEMISSLHALYLRTGNEDLTSLEESLAAESDRAMGRRLPPQNYFPEGLQYRQNVDYGPQVARYLDLFGEDQVHIVLYERFRRYPHQTLSEVADFLGAASSFRPELDLEKAQMRVRELVLLQLRQTLPEIRTKLRRWNHHHAGQRESPSKALRERLIGELEGRILQVSRHLNLDLQSWMEV